MKTIYITNTILVDDDNDSSKIGSIFLVIDNKILVNTLEADEFTPDEMLNFNDVLSNLTQEHFKESNYFLWINRFQTELEMLKYVSKQIGVNNTIVEGVSGVLRTIKNRAVSLDFFDYLLKDEPMSVSKILNNGLDVTVPGFKSLMILGSEHLDIKIKHSEALKKMGLKVHVFDAEYYGFTSTLNSKAHILIRTIMGAVTGMELYKQKINEQQKS